MVYISADGSVGGQKSYWTRIIEFFTSIFTILSLFFTTLTNPQSVRAAGGGNRRTNSTSNNQHQRRTNGGTAFGGSGARRNGGGANIRGMKNLSSGADCVVGGG